ncbi:MAG: hypothetical protein HC875_39470 [Anaerolineales bacterium]|nr:hypothetical protein [Anaerolineales bacterium]
MFPPSGPEWPSDEWLETLNFYLITNSAGQVTIDDFSDAQLVKAWQDHPGMGFADLDAAATKHGAGISSQTGEY